MIFDVSNKLNAKFVGCYGKDGYTHDTQCVVYHGPDKRYTKHEICFCYNEDTLTIVDVTDKNAMKMISKAGYKSAEYTHQGWVTDDHEIILLDDELDEMYIHPDYQHTRTYVWNVKDLEKPTLVSTYKSPEKAIDHNLYIIGDLAYQANYEAGLRIVHINKTSETLSQVAYFDVFPSSTEVSFNGAWSVFPYYPSGSVVVSSIDYGMFVVRPDLEAIRRQIDSGKAIPSTMTRSRKVLANAPGNQCPPLLETKTCETDVKC